MARQQQVDDTPTEADLLALVSDLPKPPGWMTVMEVAVELGITRPAASARLERERSKGLVERAYATNSIGRRVKIYRAVKK